MTTRPKTWALQLLAILLACSVWPAAAQSCKDPVVLVHGNAAYPSSWDNTKSELLSRGYSNTDLYIPNWGYKSCPACNNHSGWEETPVRDAIQDAIAGSCSGKIDVIGHSMGVTLAAKQIIDLNLQSSVDAFVGVASSYRGLRSCGTYPYNVQNSTCGYWGLSISSPFLDSIYGDPIADRVYSIKSWQDQVICSTGVCTVGGVHASQIAGEDASYTFAYGHFGLQTYTEVTQANLID